MNLDFFYRMNFFINQQPKKKEKKCLIRFLHTKYVILFFSKQKSNNILFLFVQDLYHGQLKEKMKKKGREREKKSPKSSIKN